MQVVRRRMLRYVFRIHRAKLDADDENWVVHLRRAKARIHQLSQELGMLEWVDTHKRRKWQFAGRLARTCDGRWSRAILDWSPYSGAGRSPGHPATRWADQLESFAGGGWLDLAADESQWAVFEEAFVEHGKEFSAST